MVSWKAASAGQAMSGHDSKDDKGNSSSEEVSHPLRSGDTAERQEALGSSLALPLPTQAVQSQIHL